MTDFNAYVSPEYPVLYSLEDDETALSLALLVNGIPSFLATVPVEPDQLDTVLGSLDSGDVRVAVVGISVDGTEIEAAGPEAESEPWKAATQAPGFDATPRESTGSEGLPAAFLSLVCQDGRRIGVARIVARRRTASPEEVARYVLKEITRGVQVPDLASAG
ncbi:MAG: hypothetical protein EA351_03710 [Gemmatimonadales bacterium]|nr:MAG: hypothetical protein EA351_03710 [Gemmatimonadales bacterium]